MLICDVLDELEDPEEDMLLHDLTQILLGTSLEDLDRGEEGCKREDAHPYEDLLQLLLG